MTDDPTSALEDDFIDDLDDPETSSLLLSMRMSRCMDAAIASKTVAIDLNGHNRRATDFGSYQKFGQLYLKWEAPNDDIKLLIKALEGGPPLEKPIRSDSSCLFKCGVCGDELVLETDGWTLRAVSTCPYPDGPIFDFELNVPSGRMVVANDLRPLFDFMGDFDINTCVGGMKHSLAMAENGCAQGFVGNTCPGVYRLDDNRLTVADGGRREEEMALEAHEFDGKRMRFEFVCFDPAREDHCSGLLRDLSHGTPMVLTRQMKGDEVRLTLEGPCSVQSVYDDQHAEIVELLDYELPPPGEYVAGICTDLWWYSIVDYDEFVRRAGEKTLKDHNAETVVVKPGVYRFCHLYYTLDRDCDDQPQTYTEIEWIREPDPVRDFNAERLAFHLTAEQVVAKSLPSYTATIEMMESVHPDLHHDGSDAIRARRRVTVAIQGIADHIFCVIGNGYDWHENGFLCDNPSLRSDAPNVEIPEFNERYGWYPLSEYSALCIAAGLHGKPKHLNKSFRALAFNVAMCIVKHGVTSFNCLGGKRMNETKKHIKAEKAQAKKTEQLAKQCLSGLAKLYPDDAPESCARLLHQSWSDLARKAVAWIYQTLRKVARSKEA